MTLRFKIVEWFLRWLISWVALIDGIFGIITFANWSTSLQLYFAQVLARYRAKHLLSSTETIASRLKNT